jgi:hypothetical protein
MYVTSFTPSQSAPRPRPQPPSLCLLLVQLLITLLNHPPNSTVTRLSGSTSNSSCMRMHASSQSPVTTSILHLSCAYYGLRFVDGLRSGRMPSASPRAIAIERALCVVQRERGKLGSKVRRGGFVVMVRRFRFVKQHLLKVQVLHHCSTCQF